MFLLSSTNILCADTASTKCWPDKMFDRWKFCYLESALYRTGVGNHIEFYRTQTFFNPQDSSKSTLRKLEVEELVAEAVSVSTQGKYS